MLIAVGVSTTTTTSTLSTRMTNMDTFSGLYNSSSKLFLIARDILVDGDISPLEDGVWHLGYLNRFGTLYALELNLNLTNTLISQIADETITSQTKHAYINGADFKSIATRQSELVVNNITYLLKKENETIEGITYTHTFYIGATNNRISIGAFTKLYADTLYLSSNFTYNKPAGQWYGSSVEVLSSSKITFTNNNTGLVNDKIYYSIIGNVLCLKISGYFKLDDFNNTEFAFVSFDLSDDTVLKNMTIIDSNENGYVSMVPCVSDAGQRQEPIRAAAFWDSDDKSFVLRFFRTADSADATDWTLDASVQRYFEMSFFMAI